MARVPAIKRRKLTPPRTDGEDSSPSTLEHEPETSAFFQQASSWNLEQDYETRPRKGRKKEKESTRLPIKTAEGLIQQAEAPEETADSDLEWLGAEESEAEEEQEEIPKKPTVPVKQQILEAQEEMARIALLLTQEDPEEHVGAFKVLANFGQSHNATIKKLALRVQLAVYKDVIPGYRIRPLSEDDMETKVSKDVRRLRAYEQALVGGYQGYVRALAKLAQTPSRWSKDGGPSLANIAISCACTLLVEVPHFNFRTDLLKILVGKLSTRRVDDDFVKCRETIETLFRDDDDGTPSLDAVSILTKMMKGKGYRVDESVLNTFLHLRLLSEFSWKASTNHIEKPEQEDGFGGKKLKEKRVFRTKKERKLMKERKVIEKEMKAADATVSHEDRDRMQSETLKLVFVTYFRILKLRSPNLMGAVLEGLASYAHLINQDFFGDLLEALKDLIGHAETGDDVEEGQDQDEDEETTRNLTREALLCIITAFALLEGQDAAKAQATLSLDLSFFITHLYRTLYALSLNTDIELSAKSLHLPDPNDPSPAQPATKNNKVNVQTTTVLLLKSLTSILTPALGARAVPPLRIAAFTKQLLTSSLHLPEKSCIAMTGLLGKVTKTHEKKIASLWNTEERRGDGTFDALGAEVEGSNPFAATVWEGELLRKHFSPAVRDGVKTMEKNVLGLR
ncbi:related to NOC3 protein, required for maturation and intranuclear transport of pre-ribosomes [Phialocephala subalpina]|uniref:Nucleolar complex-associated protein 3 n=1 Tax=Phialocephala subalpina TaxID=576137 RepID=A0A1L7XXP1_9HELO|nr:related to NOC3 protein, required for maturation and intranuclear transport of pre-ribosomes [Phialocephala subalpina]